MCKTLDRLNKQVDNSQMQICELRKLIDIMKQNIELTVANQIKIRTYSKCETDEHKMESALIFIDAYCKRININREVLTGRCQRQDLNYPRYAVYWYLYFEFGLSYSAIGSIFSGRNHSTVISGKECYESDKDIYPEYKKYTEAIHELIAEKDVNNEVILN